MAQKKINGWEEDELFMLYQFLDIYENNCLKWCNEGEALQKVTSLNKLKSIIGSFTHKEKTITEIESLDINSLNDEIYFVGRKSDLLGILYHLRNSIAHAKIIKKGDKVIIRDYENNKNPKHTAKGVIKYDIIKKIIETIK